MQYTNKIESFTIKQGVKKLYTGEDRFPQIEPTKIEFPNLIGTIALELRRQAAQVARRLHHARARTDPKAQKTGSIEFLSPDRDTDDLPHQPVRGRPRVAADRSSRTANADQIKRVKFELYVGRMDLDGAGLGLE